jgi:hypothetical protein
LARETLLQLARLTGIQELNLTECGLGELEPELLAGALGEMRKLCDLTLNSVYWGQTTDDADANESSLAAFLRGVASRRRWMQSLTRLRLEKQHAGRAAATALSKMQGLQKLKL